MGNIRMGVSLVVAAYKTFPKMLTIGIVLNFKIQIVLFMLFAQIFSTKYVRRNQNENKYKTKLLLISKI